MTAHQLQDRHGRHIDYVRISVTERCNFRCVYCMPAQGDPFARQPELLTNPEIISVANVLVEGGVKKIRITGGEPLIRSEVPELIEHLHQLEGLEHVALTTNAFLLPKYAVQLADVGLNSINISLDTLQPARFKEITRVGSLERVLEGLKAAQAAGIRDIKLNAVIIRGFNDDELHQLVAFAAKHDVIMRFIEFMPIGTQTIWGNSGMAPCVSAREMREHLSSIWSLTPLKTRFGSGPARYWQIDGDGLPKDGARVGIISAVTECFCGDCNRLRLTARGGLRACLADDGEVDLREIVRASDSTLAPLSVRLRAGIEQALAAKKERHQFDLHAPGVTSKAMNAIGG